MDLLVVNFDKTATNQVRLRCIVFGDSDDLAEGSGNDAASLFAVTTSHHRVRLTAAGLTIREDRAIVAVKHRLD